LPSVNVFAVKPLIEVSAGTGGYSWFWQQPIVTAHEQDLPFNEQGRDKASRIAQMFGDVFDYPPVKIDYLVQGFFGGLGRGVMRTSSSLVSSIEGDPPEGPPMRAEDWYIVRRFLDGPSAGGSVVITRFYEQLDDLRRINRGYTSRADDFDAQEEYYQRHADAIEHYEAMSSYRSLMTPHWNRIRELMRDRETPPDEIERQIYQEEQDLLELAREALTSGG